MDEKILTGHGVHKIFSVSGKTVNDKGYLHTFIKYLHFYTERSEKIF
jgi:hypothetical protein